MFSVHYMYICSHNDVTQRIYEAHVLESGSSTRALYISLPTVIANGTKTLLEHWYRPKKLRRLKLS